MQPQPAAPTQALGQMASSRKRNGNAAASRASATTVASPSTRLPPTVATRGIQNLPQWVALPSLLQVNRRRPLRRLSRDPRLSQETNAQSISTGVQPGLRGYSAHLYGCR